ncbi:hypothetical protein CRG98_013048 [Punica granatum]|uniref:DNA-directed RNA polymerase subunit n=1 Tax=Punica granatum TaxID=22663 RepID=A0A2I0KDG6_PUNGR|nr:hypothetical protein CRG98_013048 [Punica granatum]
MKISPTLLYSRGEENRVHTADSGVQLISASNLAAHRGRFCELSRSRHGTLSTMEAKGEPSGTEEAGSGILEAEITGITFGLASRDEINKASINECPITHASQLSNPFLGLPLDFGRCESCGTSDLGQCEGHFGYIELPTPVYHPSHVSELKKMLSLLCLKCLKMRDNKCSVKAGGLGDRLLGACCEDAAQVSVREVKKLDGACSLELKLLSKSRYHEGFWNFLERYGFRYGVDHRRALLPREVQGILKKMPKETKKKLAAKGYFPQDGYILLYLPVPPNCLSVPDVSDGVSVMSSDLSLTMLRKVLKQVEIIRSSRSGDPNFESEEVEANDLQTAVQQYLEVRGTAKVARNVDARYGVRKESSDSATKAWLEKMRTLFIRKGSGFSSRSVITGDAFKKVNEIGIPYEIAQRITFEEKVSNHNMRYLQELVDKKLCLTYKDGASTYSLREGSKGHTFLKPGQIVHRRIMDGDIVFINRPPTTHKHSLQALSVYVHEDHTVKINPLICGPLGADFDGDCIHLFYPQSLAAKAEVLELFSVEKQLLSSHSGNLNLQLATDALLSLKLMFRRYFFDKPSAQQLAMFVSSDLPQPAILKADRFRSSWTVLQMLQMALPTGFDCSSDKYLIRKSDILSASFGRDVTSLMIPSMLPSMLNEIVTYIIFNKGPQRVLNFFNSLQPLLMENVFAEGFSVSLEDFYAPKSAIRDIHSNILDISPLLYYLTSSHNELVQRHLERDIRRTRDLLLPFILDYSALGVLIDSKSESAINKVVQQIGFLGLQLSNKGKFYSVSLFDEMASLYESKYPFDRADCPAGKYGMIKSSFISGLDPYEVMAHSISTREVIVRSTRGLSEPGTLFKNLMAILRDVVICYDGTVRNVCSNSIIQFEYGAGPGSKPETLFPPGEPVGVLAATAMSNPAYKAVLDSSPNSNSSWEQMKEILLCRVNFRNEPIDRRVILYLNDCGCGRNHCRENAACVVKNHLSKISLKDASVEFMAEFKDQRTVFEGSGMHSGLVGHIHLNEVLLRKQNISMLDVQQRCQETLQKFRKKKKVGFLFKKIVISVSEGCCFHHLRPAKKSETPCLSFSLMDWTEVQLEKTAHILADMICPVLLETIIKGDPRIASANIIWISSDMNTRIKNQGREEKGELALDVTLEKPVCKRSGDAWRIILDCCLPFLHLIDTRRSIPYAVKQIEELLGISCAFDQAVQRLSTSVTMVAKGILKEHLILLADTMTCCGNLIGFNSGGYKALSRALGVQVPFTEATLFTPRKCFERASEKSHTDSLSSVVASCSWGKPVAVGTGSKFDLLWGTQEMDLKHEGETDIYGFLHMVRGTKVVTGLDTGCLGMDVDHLNNEGEDADLCLSPENDGGLGKPSFEDSELFKDTFGSEPAGGDSWSTWDKQDTSKKVEDDSFGSGGWDSNVSWGKKTDIRPETGPSNADSWSTRDKQETSKKVQDDSFGSGGWDSNASWGKKTDSRPETGPSNADSWSTWDKQDTSKKVQDDSFGSGGWGGKASNKNDASATGDLLKSDERESVGWGKDKSGAEFRNSWGSYAEPPVQESENHEHWGQQRSQKTGSEAEFGNSGWGMIPKSTAQESETPDTWGQQSSKRTGNEAESGNCIWGSSWKPPVQERKNQGPWGHKSSENSEQSDSGWGSSPKSKAEATEKQGNWGQQSSNYLSSNMHTESSWGKDKAAATSDFSGGSGDNRVGSMSWDSAPSWRKSKDDDTFAQPSGWPTQEKNEVQTVDANTTEVQGNDSWSNKGKEAEDCWKSGAQITEGTTWGYKVEAQGNDSKSSWNGAISPKVNDGGWGSNKDDDFSSKSDGWNDLGNQSSKGWNKKENDSSPKADGWGKKSEGSQSSKDWGKRDDDVSTPKTDGWNSSGWGSKSEDADQSNNWSSSQGAEESKSQNQWAPKEWRKNHDGNKKGSNPEWKIRKNRPPRPPDMMSQQDPNAPRLFTATRQRLDMFTSEEQDILNEVEAIMQAIRKIMRQPGYNDSEPLSAEDQSYIVDHVLNYHPDKASKIGSGIDHIMVSKHGSFQDTRCFYVVSTDGRKEDFSYRKCLENFIKGKCPDHAEEFIGKYFKRRDRDRNAGFRERSVSVPPEETGTPGE